MARKKSATAAEATTQPQESISGTEQNYGAQDQQANTRSQGNDGPASSAAPEQDGDGKAPRFIRNTFSSKAAGIRAGEDKRFNAPQVFIDFDDDQRATPEEKAELAQAGLRYRPKDKGYSALATAETRQSRDELAQKFTDRRMKEKTERGEGNKR
jgi:hypothetical protein